VKNVKLQTMGQHQILFDVFCNVIIETMTPVTPALSVYLDKNNFSLQFLRLLHNLVYHYNFAYRPLYTMVHLLLEEFRFSLKSYISTQTLRPGVGIWSPKFSNP